jgi:hypothetical protein
VWTVIVFSSKKLPKDGFEVGFQCEDKNTLAHYPVDIGEQGRDLRPAQLDEGRL